MRQELARLEASVALCERCFGPEPRTPVRFERPAGRGRILILGERAARSVLEAQQRLGLDCSDAGTRFLRSLLDEARIPREEVVLGAAVLCRPRSRELERAVSATVCVRECAVFVRELVRAVQPRLIVPLGGRALRSLRTAFDLEAELAGARFPESVGATMEVGGAYVHPLYHTTVRARVTRPAADQRRDWRVVGRLWEWIAGGERGRRPRARSQR